MYLVELCGGEWDDAYHVPFLIVETLEEARIVEDEILSEDSDLYDNACAVLDTECLDDVTVGITEVPFYSLDDE